MSRVADAEIQQIIDDSGRMERKFDVEFADRRDRAAAPQPLTRQALHKYERIRYAFELVKNSPAVEGKAKEYAYYKRLQIAV